MSLKDATASDAQTPLNAIDFAVTVLKSWRLLLSLPVAAGLVALGFTYLTPPTFTATTVLLPPQQAQSSAAAALASLGALAGAVGGTTGARGSAEQYVALMQSTTASDRVIEKFDLDALYKTDFRFQTRKLLRANVRITSERRSGLIIVEADDTSPQRAADLANEYVNQLRLLTSELAITEAQQRRRFFEEQLNLVRKRLVIAQSALQTSGVNESVLKTEPKAAADGFAKLQAELTTAEVRLQAMRFMFTENAPEYKAQLSTVTSLRQQVARVEATSKPQTDTSDYVSKYREFKYQEALADLFTRQYEAARVDESRDGPLVQVVDHAKPPEYKSRPLRGIIAAVTSVFTFAVVVFWLVLRQWWTHSATTDSTASRNILRLRSALFRT